VFDFIDATIEECCAKLSNGASLISKIADSLFPHLKKLVVPANDDILAAHVSSADPKAYAQNNMIGGGEIVLGPLCRACIRLGRYIVQKPPNTTNLDIAAEESKIEVLVRPIGKELGRLSRAFAASPCYLPHAWSEVLKALLWIMPENRYKWPYLNTFVILL
jgi:hypothetical protein